MKNIKNVMLSIAILGLMIFFSSTRAFAAISDEVDNLEELYGLAIQNYTVDDYIGTQENLDRTEDIIVSSDNVVIENNAESGWIDVIAKLDNGKYVNITDEVKWDSENYDIAYAFNGRILAEAPGETNITVKYGAFKKNIHVSILHYLDVAAEIERLDALEELENEDEEDIDEEIEPFISGADRDTIIEKAKAMTEITWMPTEKLNGWDHEGHFKPRTEYRGVPYSQTDFQKDDKGFEAAMAGSDFYKKYERNNILMPKYGSDCSGFVSFAWGLKRKTTYDFAAEIKSDTYKKVGSYYPSNLDKKILEKAYTKFKKGDAVVFRHTNVMQFINIPGYGPKNAFCQNICCTFA